MMEKIISEEHLYFGVYDYFVAVCDELDSEDKIRLRVYDSNQNELCSYIACTKGKSYTKDDYARILANCHCILDNDLFVKTGYRFRLSCGIVVECIISGDRVSIYSEAEHRLANTPFVGVEALRKYVCENFGGIKLRVPERC